MLIEWFRVNMTNMNAKRYTYVEFSKSLRGKWVVG